MTELAELLLRTWAANRDYAERLTADIPDDGMIAQPVPGVVMNHPAWVIAHLSAYPPVLAAMLRGETPTDPKDHPYGRDSKPESSPRAYPRKTQLLSQYFGAHDEAAAAMEAAPEETLRATMPLERWRGRFPTVAHACVHLMTSHEATHLGQLSAWRRAGGRPAV